MNPTRPTALSTNGVVATPHYLASQAGAIMLREDGVLAGGADPRGDGLAAAW
jgi:gamma-glutamyltranspeptidase